MDVVAIGGGTGLFTSLRALKLLQGSTTHGSKDYRTRLSAIVSVVDDGGSTGRLRDEFGVLPPGDLRRALVALSQDTGALRKLFNYRFTKGKGLEGHNMGNLLLTALTDIYGSEYEAIRHAGRILRVQGRVIPVTTGDARLWARLEDGTIIRGETNIDIPKHDGTLRIVETWLDPRPALFDAAADALATADIILIGPGDLYTSIVPNFLVDGFREELIAARERGTSIVFVTNTMTKHGETNGFSAKDFLDVIERQLGKGVLTHVVCNVQRPTPDALRGYREERAEFVEPDISPRDDLVVIEQELILDNAFVRHDPRKLADAYAHIIASHRRAIIFDLDDTLILTSQHQGPKLAQHLRRILQEQGKDVKIADILLQKRVKMGMYNALLAEGFEKDEAESIFEQYNSLPLEKQFAAEDLPVLKELRRTARLFLITRGHQEYQRKKVELHDLARAFERIVYVDTRSSSTKLQAIIDLIRERGLDPGTTWVVGDNLHDELAAAAGAGVKAVLIDRTGKHRGGEIGSTIRTLHELPAIIGGSGYVLHRGYRAERAFSDEDDA